jgi:L-threonylcarbamoyladenylate synthase
MTLTVAEAAARIRAGGVVAFPTETVYGLGANALDPSAVARIFELKGRPSTSPVIVHVASAAMAREVAAEWPPLAEELARRWWPGPLTLVLPKRRCVPDIVTAGLGTVGVRQPAHSVAAQLIETAGVPLAAPSANKFGQLSPTCSDHVRRAFGDRVDIVEGGVSQVGIESTVVAVKADQLTLLRPGMISFPAIERAAAGGTAAHQAPGMHPRHYAPRTPVLLVSGCDELPGREGAYLWRESSGASARSIRMPARAGDYAARLYSVLHELDQEGWPWIAVEMPPDSREWTAIRDRLQRAATR